GPRFEANLRQFANCRECIGSAANSDRAQTPERRCRASPMRALLAHIARIAGYASVRIQRSSFGLHTRAMAARDGATLFDLAISGLTAGRSSTEARSAPSSRWIRGYRGSRALALLDNLRQFTDDPVAAAARRPDDEPGADGSGP